MFEIKDEAVKQLESDLKTFASRSLPFATKATLNKTAFEARKEWQSEIRNRMVNRNKFTQQSIRVEQARSLNIRSQESIVGSIAEYMDTQEFGGTSKGGSTSKPIATSYSAGQGQGVRPRTRAPRKANTMSRIRLRKTRGVSSRKARNVAAVKVAAETGNRYAYLDLGRRKGIFKVLGSKRKLRVKMVWDLTRRTVRVPRTPTLGPAVRNVAPRVPEFYQEAMEFQARRHKLFGR